MQKQADEIEQELNKRIYNLFLVKFNNNKSKFASAAECSEGTIRRIFKNEQSITINLLIRIAGALDTTVSELLQGLSVKKED